MISVLGLGTDLLSFDSQEILAAMVKGLPAFYVLVHPKSLIDAVTQSLRYIVQSSDDLDITVRDVVKN
jgi:hypothetical protein